ncbi:MAG: hypothetical protein NTW21_07020 [Verrucomicrobia bacterium]|nr:hypothetical protein [Verrucomicrobiota bacterium]
MNRQTARVNRLAVRPSATGYHVFTVDADGTSLKQITDGTWNDCDPCWLPNRRRVA